MNVKTLSHCQGSGSLSHNNRKFFAKNVDQSKTKNNIIFVQEPIEQAYEHCFGEAVERYNAKQKRNDRKIKEGYFKHTFKHKPCNTVVTSSDKRKSFYEDLVQIGTMDDTAVGTLDGDIATQCLVEYMETFRQRNPNLYVFNAVIHVDESTPHLHIDYIPLGHYQRGVDTQNSISQALKEMGFDHAKDSIHQWRLNERHILEDICKRHNIEISEPKKSRGYSFTVDEYKEYKSTIDALKEEQLQAKNELQQTKTELEPLKKMADEIHQADIIGEIKEVGVFKKKTQYVLTPEEYYQLKNGYDMYVINRDTLKQRLMDTETLQNDLNQRSTTLSQREKEVSDHEQLLADHDTLQQKYQSLEERYTSICEELSDYKSKKTSLAEQCQQL